MKILVVCQRYWPEQFQVTSVSEGLVARGHDVTVLCGLPNVGLPEGESGMVPEEYRHGNNRRQMRNGVKIFRVTEIGRRSGFFWRVLNYYSFWKSAVRAVRKLDAGFDAVLAYQLSPAMMAAPAVEYKRMFGAPVLLYCCDLWPESMKVVLGDRLPFVVDHFGRICRRIYRSVDRIAVQTDDFIDYFECYHGVEGRRLFCLPQFSTDGDSVPVAPVAHDGINVMYMGNIGKAQLVDEMVQASEFLPDGIALHFVGDGTALPAVKNYAESHGLADRVVFHGRKALEDLTVFYAQADICILGLDPSCMVGLTVPSKLQGYMAAGRPVIAIARGGAREIIEDASCGIAVEPGDVRAVAEAIVQLAQDAELRRRMGENARRYSEGHFLFTAHMDRIEYELSALAGKGEE